MLSVQEKFIFSCTEKAILIYLVFYNLQEMIIEKKKGKEERIIINHVVLGVACYDKHKHLQIFMFFVISFCSLIAVNCRCYLFPLVPALYC